MPFLTRKNQPWGTCLWPSSSATWGLQGNIAATKVWTSIHGSCRCYGASESARCKITLCIYRQKVWWKSVDEHLRKVVLMHREIGMRGYPAGWVSALKATGTTHANMASGKELYVSCDLLFVAIPDKKQLTTDYVTDLKRLCDINHYASQHLKWPAIGWKLTTTVQTTYQDFRKETSFRNTASPEPGESHLICSNFGKALMRWPSGSMI
jgi:hypothetical protein